MTAAARDFDVAGSEARRLWHEIARTGEDTVAVARASYARPGKARHRLNSIAWLAFDAQFCRDARLLAVEALGDRSSKVVEAAARALAWGWDVTLLAPMREAEARASGAARADIAAAIAAAEAGNPNLFLDRTGGGRLRLHVADHDWRALRGGLVRTARPDQAATLAEIARTTGASGRAPTQEELRAAWDNGPTCWIAGEPVAGFVVARAAGGALTVETVAATDPGTRRTLLDFAGAEARRRGLAPPRQP